MRILLTLVLFLCSAIAAGTEYALRYNPFERPSLNTRPAGTDSGPAVGEAMVLKATLAAGSGALANINGQLFRLGDEVNGFRITEINEGSVSLSRNEQVRRLTVQDEHSE